MEESHQGDCLENLRDVWFLVEKEEVSKWQVWFRNGKGSVQTQQALFGGRQAVHLLVLPPFAEVTFIMF